MLARDKAEREKGKLDDNDQLMEAKRQADESRKTEEATDGEGLGFKTVAPPFNHNYISSLETEESKESYFSNFVQKDQSANAENEVIVEDASEEDKDSPSPTEHASTSHASSSAVTNDCTKTVDVDSTTSRGDASNSKNQNVKKFKPRKFVKEGEIPVGQRPSPTKCDCACTCDNSLKNSKGQGPNHNLIYLKRQMCFNCGITGHIACNYPYRPYIPFYAQHWQNVPKGRSSKRKPSRSRSRDGYDLRTSQVCRQRWKTQLQDGLGSQDKLIPHLCKSSYGGISSDLGGERGMITWGSYPMESRRQSSEVFQVMEPEVKFQIFNTITSIPEKDEEMKSQTPFPVKVKSKAGCADSRPMLKPVPNGEIVEMFCSVQPNQVQDRARSKMKALNQGDDCWAIIKITLSFAFNQTKSKSSGLK
ncbi:hypothetical protein L2E82_35328 [Cichorium intybus]|uniref:Uncharacterized protein n=1 Tax=Cichorium intybus TaxID=13427 RepID=A0ACB9BNI3_CICIN|nr:hypothetical protein L2E82_35328 [Cichorium intybus]